MLTAFTLILVQDLFDDLRRRGEQVHAEADLDVARFDLRRPALLARRFAPVEFEHRAPDRRFDYAATLRDLYLRNVREEHLNADTSGLERSQLVDLAYLSPTVYDAYKYYVTLSQLQSIQLHEQWSDLEQAAEELAARRRARARLEAATDSLFESLKREGGATPEVSVLRSVPSLTETEREALRRIVGDVLLTRDGLRTNGLKRGGLLERYEQLRAQYEQRWQQAVESGDTSGLAPPGMAAPSRRDLQAMAILPEPARRHATAAAASAGARAEAVMTAHHLAEALEAALLVADVDADVARELARMRDMLESQARRLDEHARAQMQYAETARAVASQARATEAQLARTWVARQGDAAAMSRAVEEIPRFGSDSATQEAWSRAGTTAPTAPRRWLDGGGWGWADLPQLRLRIDIEYDEEEDRVKIRVGS